VSLRAILPPELLSQDIDRRYISAPAIRSMVEQFDDYV